MFGEYIVINKNEAINRVDFEILANAFFKSANNDGLLVINTPLARVYLNDDSYFNSVPESIWESAFDGEISPKLFLEARIGKSMSNDEVLEFQKLLKELINAEFDAKNK
jgi:hypothetical protein